MSSSCRCGCKGWAWDKTLHGYCIVAWKLIVMHIVELHECIYVVVPIGLMENLCLVFHIVCVFLLYCNLRL